MNFDLIRTEKSDSSDDFTTKISEFKKTLLTNKILSISFDQINILQNNSDNNNQPFLLQEGHLLVDKKFIKNVVAFSIKNDKNHDLISIFAADIVKYWNRRRERFSVEKNLEEEVEYLKLVSLFQPKSMELWSYFGFILTKISKNPSDKLLIKLLKTTQKNFNLQQISSAHFSNYNFWRFYANLCNKLLSVKSDLDIQNIEKNDFYLSYEEFRDKILKNSLSDSSLVTFFINNYSRNTENCQKIIKDLNQIILLYDQSERCLLTLWSAKIQVLSKVSKPGGENLIEIDSKFIDRENETFMMKLEYKENLLQASKYLWKIQCVM